MLSLFAFIQRNAWTIALHLPVGAFSAGLLEMLPLHGILLAAGFIAYEIMEDWRLRDKSFRDVFGFLVGFGGAALVLFTLEVL